MDQRTQKQSISMLPQLSWRSFFASKFDRPPSFLDTGLLHLVPSGRIAIALALEYLGVGPGSEVLLPAYHCPSMIEPVTWLGAKPVFYKIQADTSPDLADFQKNISPMTRAALGVHFFGRVQDFRSMQATCRAADIGFIEDCAHACFGAAAGIPVGNFGDIAIASLRKFFPLYDGGCLYSATQDLSKLRTTGLGAQYQVKALYDSIEEPVSFGKLPAFRPVVSVAHHLRGRRRKVQHLDENTSPEFDIVNHESGYSDRRYSKDSMHGRISHVSRIVFGLAERNRVVEKRIHHYRLLEQEFSKLSRARPLFQDLQEQSAPYVFPLEIDDPDLLHGLLKRANVPMWRWEVLRTDICEISNRYSRSVIQLPCHQELTQTEIERLIATTKQILR